jgi:hypothetical protein
MPNNQALQVFYGSIPLILVLGGIFFREQLLLKDILKRLGNLEARLDQFKTEVRAEFKETKTELSKIKERLTVLETRAGILYHE